MSICLATYYDQSYRTLGDMCWQSIKKYAARYGYSHQRFHTIESDRPKAWNKIPVILDLFDQGHDFVFWLDADALFVRFDRDIAQEIEEGKDWYLVNHYRLGGEVPNTGVMLLRNSQESRALLQQMWDSKHHLTSWWWENAAFIEITGLAGLVPESRRFMFSQEVLSRAPDPAMLRKIKWLHARWNHTPMSPLISDFVIRHYPGAAYKKRLQGMAMDIRKTSRFYYLRHPEIIPAALTGQFELFKMKNSRKKIKQTSPSNTRTKLRWIASRLRNKKPPEILFDLRTAGVGNIVEITPAIVALKRLCPQSLVDLWIEPKELLMDGPEALQIRHIYQKKEIPEAADEYDLRFNLTYDASQADCVSGKVVWIKPPLNQSEEDYYLNRIHWLGYQGAKPERYVSTQPVDLDFPSGRLKIAILNCGKEKNFGLQGESKRWPYYDRLIAQLIAGGDVQIYLIGSDQDQYSLTDSSGAIIDCRGKYSLPQTAFILKQCDLAIGNDCGPMHMADAVKTKCCIIWGPTSEIKNSYQGDYVSISHTDLDCRPCQGRHFNTKCQSQECLYGLYPDVVLSKIKEIQDLKVGNP
ncbi:MAG: hypothetical protein HYZ84_07440 [Candidatus Omnitrophica bacterium]|nr:hypothetical protein [Candidatus Omnitrophota bacterium]